MTFRVSLSAAFDSVYMVLNTGFWFKVWKFQIGKTMTCIIKNVCVRTLLRISHQVTNLVMLGRGICPISSSPAAFDRFTAPVPGDLPSIRQNENQIPGGYPGGGGLCDRSAHNFPFILSKILASAIHRVETAKNQHGHGTPSVR